MSGLLILRALLFAGECFLASLLLPVLAFAAAALLRRRAALRHLVWTTMFGVLAVLPLVALLLPPRRIVEHVAAPAAYTVAAPVIAAPPPSLALSPGDLLTPENIVMLLVALWLAGLCWQLLRMGVGGLGLLRLRRHSVPFATELRTGCDVRLSRGEDGPSTFGILRPIVLLPRSAPAWPSARLDAVLRHEAAHVARRDTLSQFIARLVCAVFWPNPLLWLAARSLRREAEIAADDAVLAGGMMPSLYAAELVSLAAESRGLTPRMAPGIAMAGPPLAQRVEAVLAENSSRKGVTRMDMAKTATLGLTAALLLGVARFDIALAQDAAPPAPPAPAASPAPGVEVPVERNVEIEQRVEARSAAIKARADAVAARAQAKAAAETDPAKREQYRKEAAQVAAQSQTLKADADRMRVQARERAAEVQQRTATIRSQMEQIRPQIELALADAHVNETVAKALADAHIGEAVAKALDDAHLDEATRKALQDAHIEEKITQELARLQPQIKAAIDRAGRSAVTLTTHRGAFTLITPPSGPGAPPAPPVPPARSAPFAPPVPPAPPPPPPAN